MIGHRLRCQYFKIKPNLIIQAICGQRCGRLRIRFYGIFQIGTILRNYFIRQTDSKAIRRLGIQPADIYLKYDYKPYPQTYPGINELFHNPLIIISRIREFPPFSNNARII